MAASSFEGRPEYGKNSDQTKKNGMKQYRRSFSAPKEASFNYHPKYLARKEQAQGRLDIYFANLEYIFNKDHSYDATKLMNRHTSLGLDKLKNLDRMICAPKESPQVHPF
ncbi:uncharacterized protein PADG_11622 [Paracoccidioides brasiliensis Pb18]|uniref:Uncharacterized protein n=1 Tax=Paracoccidioides brasiliensis (strain Pb18) TaxID=502780 RepID=A0A0A0HTX6_PARBD|nr:uncharacterized protein PADG_11622 [Paracoccidioides brasiliensis Pb18]KGM92092.1 hypothetical protein PADG_11622 [Paracoccidioides brasiliensis Pb18]